MIKIVLAIKGAVRLGTVLAIIGFVNVLIKIANIIVKEVIINITIINAIRRMKVREMTVSATASAVRTKIRSVVAAVGVVINA